METTNLLLPSTRMTRLGMVNPTFIEDAVIVSEKEQEKEHPNFIESNTSGTVSYTHLTLPTTSRV